MATRVYVIPVLRRQWLCHVVSEAPAAAAAPGAAEGAGGIAHVRQRVVSALQARFSKEWEAAKAAAPRSLKGRMYRCGRATRS